MRVTPFVVFGLMPAVSLSLRMLPMLGRLVGVEGLRTFFEIDSLQNRCVRSHQYRCLPAWTAIRVTGQDNVWVFHGGFASGRRLFESNRVVNT